MIELSPSKLIVADDWM